MSLDFITLNISSILEQLVHWSQTANQKRNSQSHRNDSWLLRNCWLTLPNWSYLIIDFSPKLFFSLSESVWTFEELDLTKFRYILQGAKSFVHQMLLSHHIVVIQMSDKPPAGTKSFILNMVPEVCPVPGNFEPHAFSHFYVYKYKYTYIYIYILYVYIYICLSWFFIGTIYNCICLLVV